MKKITTLFFLAFLYLQCFGQMNAMISPPAITNESECTICLVDSAKSKFYSKYYINQDSVYCPDLYCEIYSWIGVKYAYGKGTKKGTDCSHFVSNVTRGTLGYKCAGSAATMYSICEKVNKSDLQEGDLVFFKINKKNVSHVGVYLQNGKFAHATVHGGVMINDLDEAYYKKYFIGGGKPK